MGYVKKIQIRGVGANKELNVKFSRHVTSIVGKNFIGKSWLIRALKLVCLNVPSGTSFINWDSKKAKVRLSVGEKRIVRTRSERINSYKLSGKKKPYTGFGNDVPKDIAEILNLSELNFQGQHEAPFWFNKTAGEVSKELNRIVNLEVIDKTLASIKSQKRKAKTAVELYEKSLAKALKEKRRLKYAKKLDAALKNVEKLQEAHEKDSRDCDTMAEKLDLIAKYRAIRENRLKLISGATSAISAGEEYQKTANLSKKLSKLIKSAESLQKTIDNRPPSIEPLERMRKKVEYIEMQKQKLGIMIDGIIDWREKRCQANQRKEKAELKLKKSVKGRCPLCGAKKKS